MSIFAQAIKKPEHSPIMAANVNIEVPGLRINITPINPMINMKNSLVFIFSLRIGIANKAIKRGDAAFSNVASDKPIFEIAKYKHVIADILISPRKICIWRIDVFINEIPWGKINGIMIIKPTKLLKKTNWIVGNSEDAALIQAAITAKKQAEKKAGKKPWIM